MVSQARFVEIGETGCHMHMGIYMVTKRLAWPAHQKLSGIGAVRRSKAKGYLQCDWLPSVGGYAQIMAFQRELDLGKQDASHGTVV